MRRGGRSLVAHNGRIRDELNVYRGREVKTTGDGFLAIFDSATRAVRCAAAVTRSARAVDLRVRVGIHTGEVDISGGDARGIAVHAAARILSVAGPGEVLVSSTTAELLEGSGLLLEDAGTHELKGISGARRLFRLRSVRGALIDPGRLAIPGLPWDSPMTIAPNDFTHLHVHSEFSLLDGLGRIDDLVGEASALGFDSLAITDHGALYGAVAFYQACQTAEHQAHHRRRDVRRPPVDDRPRGQQGLAAVPPRSCWRRTGRATRTCAASSPTPTSTATTTSRASTATTWPSTARGSSACRRA